MRARIAVGLLLLWPTSAIAAEPRGNRANYPGQRSKAREALAKKLAESERLQREIEQLRQLAGEPRPNVRVRVRIIETSLAKIEQMGLSWPDKAEGPTREIEAQLKALLANRSAAKLLADETLTIALGVEGRMRAGTELPESQLAKVNADPGKFAFRGTEITVTPRSQGYGQLAIDLVCKQLDPMLGSNQGPRLGVHELATSVKLGPEDAVILDGGTQDRVASETIGFPLVGRLFSRETETAHQMQQFVIISREPAVRR
jgi:type II secretory pathway component GspD/PulD (secretin)